MRKHFSIPRRLWFALYRCAPCVAVCAGLLVAAVPSRAQDVAEAARQEKARKAKEQKAEHHVYTNDDLKREHILTPRDQARAEAKRKNSPAAPDNQQQQAKGANKNSNQESLGEIARRYRREKAAREAKEALKKESAPGFPMKIPAQTFGSPMDAAPTKPLAVPHREVRPPRYSEKILRKAPRYGVPSSPDAPRGVVVNPAPNVSRDFATSRRPFLPKRVSPFQPRPYVAPVAPEVPSRTLRVVPMAPQPPARALGALPALPPVAATHGKVKAVIVQAGDSWWKLSREYLGRGSRWQEVMALNPGNTDPRKLAAGSEILVPMTEPTSRGPKQSTGITVRRGDTLWSIAQARYGSGARWHCIAQANSWVTNPDLILPGQQLLVPESCGNSKAMERHAVHN